MAELGYHPIPVVAGGKMPIAEYRLGGKRGFKAELRSAAGIKAAWAKYPSANLAICLPGLIQIDLDSTEAVEAISKLDLPQVPTFKTPKSEHGKGGLRLIFKDAGHLPDNVGRRHSGKGVVDGIEWSRGRQMIGLIAPSHYNGEKDGNPGSYRTVIGFDQAEPADLSELPQLVALLAPPEAARKPWALPAFIPEGERNTTLAASAALFRAAGMSEAELHAAVTALNDGPRVQGRLRAGEISDIVKSALKVPAKPWSGPACEDFIAHLVTVYEIGKPKSSDKGNAIHVLRYLLNRCDSEGQITRYGPTLKTIGEAIGSERSARQGIRELERSGLLIREKDRLKPTKYYLRLHP